MFREGICLISLLLFSSSFQTAFCAMYYIYFPAFLSYASHIPENYMTRIMNINDTFFVFMPVVIEHDLFFAMLTLFGVQTLQKANDS